MGAYLLDFKQKMQTRGNDDTMELDEAAWHLSSIVNYDLGDVVNNYESFRYDTLYFNINVENGRVSISDLNTLYTRVAGDISTYFSNLNLENKHIRFIGADIEDDGTVVMSIMVTYGWWDHLWYFPDVLTLYTTLSPYFDDNYTCDYDVFTDTLNKMLNTLVGSTQILDTTTAIYVVANTVDFEWDEYTDLYGSYWESNSRLFAAHVIPTFRQDDFFYCFDSYAGLGVDSTWCGIHHYDIIDFVITKNIDTSHQQQNVACHKLTVRYGVVVPIKPKPDPQH